MLERRISQGRLPIRAVGGTDRTNKRIAVKARELQQFFDLRGSMRGLAVVCKESHR
jgi:hypothetical protein